MSLHLRKHVVVTDKDYDERTVCCFINPWTQSSIIIMFDRLLCCACWWCRIIKTKSPRKKMSNIYQSNQQQSIKLGFIFWSAHFNLDSLLFSRKMLHYFLCSTNMYRMNKRANVGAYFVNFIHDWKKNSIIICSWFMDLEHLCLVEFNYYIIQIFTVKDNLKH